MNNSLLNTESSVTLSGTIVALKLCFDAKIYAKMLSDA